MKNGTKLLASVLAVGALGSVAGLGIYGAFTTTTSNTGNEISAGTVTLSDNDSGSALYTLTGAAPGDSITKCIKVSYSGSLAADVDLYTHDGTIGPLAPYVNLTITQGTQTSSTFPSCTGFTPKSAGAVLYSGTLENFGTTHYDAASGLATFPGLSDVWGEGDSVVYQFQATVDPNAPISAQATTTGSHGFIWTAVNL